MRLFAFRVLQSPSLHTVSLCKESLTRAILLVMNALDTPLAVLRQLLTRGSVLTSLGNDTLTQIRGVSYGQSIWTAELQNLGFITNFGYSSFPPPYGQAPQPIPVPDNLDETPTKLADLGLGETFTVAAPNQAPPSTSQKREAVRLPKVKQKRQVAKPIPQPASVNTTVSEPAKYCQVCHWRFPATYTDTQLRRHLALSAANQCKEDIAEYREAQRNARKSRQTPQKCNPYLEEQSLAAQYGGVRLCPHCKLSLESGFTPHSKKTHIEACAQPRVRPTARRADPSDPFALGLSLLKKRRVVVEDSN